MFLCDKLSAIECSSEIIDQLGELSLKSVEQSYGRGYEINIIYSWLTKIN